ncbi:NYN domain-containing protein [Vagococcus entomophilus]|uniref:DNA-binding protein n=1 Tax=Vagococcus entomophilus TaxID=1160095 RepID=A0A430AFW6_9ENTE|nr:NYN domain-containing protein [Vagococcus entomophilus]RSU06609.1 DNA-binding protein [Vagococcus entomophilus]
MKQQLLIVDGYNMIGAWPDLVKLKNQDNLEDARDLLLSHLANYAKYEGIEVIVVFDAQFVPGIQKSYEKYQLQVIFTKKDETADSYIEKLAGERNNRLTQVTVATSDLAEQWMVFSKGALRTSANEFYKTIKKVKKNIDKAAEDFKYQQYRRNSPWDAEQLYKLENLRDDLSH